MPYYEDYTYAGTTDSSGTSFTWSFSGALQQMYGEWQEECKRQDQMYELQMQMHEQEMEEKRQLIEDKRKYPLFYLKEGIV